MKTPSPPIKQLLGKLYLAERAGRKSFSAQIRAQLADIIMQNSEPIPSDYPATVLKSAWRRLRKPSAKTLATIRAAK